VHAPVAELTRRPAADASVIDMLQQRTRQLELECDGLRSLHKLLRVTLTRCASHAEAQRASRLEVEVAAAHTRIEQLTNIISSSKSARTPSAPTAAPAAAATPSCSDASPLKVAHRTPCSAATQGLDCVCECAADGARGADCCPFATALYWEQQYVISWEQQYVIPWVHQYAMVLLRLGPDHPSCAADQNKLPHFAPTTTNGKQFDPFC